MALTTRYVTSDGTGTWAEATNSATPAPWATMLTDAVAGDLCKIFGSFTLAGSSVMTAAGTTTSPIILQGCGGTPASPLEGNQGRTNVNGPLVLTNMPTIAFDATFGLTTLTNTILESLNISAAIAGGAVTLGINCLIKGCKIINASTNAAAVVVAPSTACVIFDSDVELTGASGGSAAITAPANGVRILYSRVKGGPSAGASCASAVHLVVIGCVFFTAGTNHIKPAATSTVTLIGNTFVGATSTAILMTSASTQLSVFVNNMVTDNGAYGVNWVSAAGAGLYAYNRFRDNTSGNVNLGVDWKAAATHGEVTTDTGGSETDYTNSGTGDYSLISASPAKAAGWLSYTDIGALQRQEAGGAAVFNPLAQTIITVL